ncbi:EamA family transporter [Aliikangiella marina]|uniref:EamA family transporter n=1 Tax=Aliikangiella marina TaxID=1712262 RepID=A0A545TJ59_9GAMM|nr:DMT family transporter [Aliikangiella marina]TQV77270.1 EamA family transporter [Aliikangiella marina]
MTNLTSESNSNRTNQLLVTVSCLTALVAFAANSVLCRLALGNNEIDPSSFTLIRVVSGAVTLTLIVQLQGRNPDIQWRRMLTDFCWNTWVAPLMLFVYAVFFSFAYLQLDTATGALILFATVQLCMIGFQIVKGQRLSLLEWFGVLLSIAGFVWLMLPSASTPPLIGFMLMFVAGIGWAFYTLQGKKSKSPTSDTAENFLRGVPLCLPVMLFYFESLSFTSKGFWLAVASGALASGMGYTIWYFTVKRISITVAAISQLSVPVIAAVGGVFLVNETLSTAFVFAAGMIITGIGIVSLAPKSNKSS